MRSNSSHPMVWPMVLRPVCMPVSPVATAFTEKKVRTWSSVVSRPSLLATRMRRRLPPTDAVTWLISPPAARAAASARRRIVDLVGLGHVLGEDADVVGRRGHRLGERPPSRTPPPPRRAAADAASAAVSRPGFGEIGGVGEAGGVADDDPDAGATVAARGELLDPAVVEHAVAVAPVLGEDLGELAAGAQRGVEHPFEDGLFDHRRRAVAHEFLSADGGRQTRT